MVRIHFRIGGSPAENSGRGAWDRQGIRSIADSIRDALGLVIYTFLVVLTGRWRSLVQANRLRVVLRTEAARPARRPAHGPAYSQPGTIASPSGRRLSLRGGPVLLSYGRCLDR